MKPLFDAHNHLQDERLSPHLPAVLAAARAVGVARMVVNGSCEEDWPQVLALAHSHAEVLPSFGLHPWYVPERTPDWQAGLIRHLDALPAAVGEIGLDRWIQGHDLPQQEEAFAWQIELAAARNLPASIHCLQAWGRLLEMLRAHRRPAVGFVLHAFGGPREMIRSFADLGAYFSFPPSFAREKKVSQRETFRHVPPERLLIETDAPDLPPPTSLNTHPLEDRDGKLLNHPANLAASCRFLAEFLGKSDADLREQLAANFQRLFGGVAGATPPPAPASA